MTISKAGNILDTLIFVSSNKLIPIQKIIIEPTKEIPSVIAVDKNGAINVASIVIAIWKINTGSALNVAPKPNVAV